jgi:hypothetical protein
VRVLGAGKETSPRHSKEIQSLHEKIGKAEQDSFRSPYIDPHGGVDNCIQQMEEMFSKFNAAPEDFVGALTSIEGASFSGKTRLVKEIALRKTVTIFLGLRAQHHEGFAKGAIPPAALRYLSQSFDYSNWEDSERRQVRS